MTEQLSELRDRGLLEEYRCWRSLRGNGGWLAMINDMACGEPGRTMEEATDNAIAAWMDSADDADRSAQSMRREIAASRRD